MLLKDGMITLLRKTDVSDPGSMPRYEDRSYSQSYYAELHFETRPVYPTEGREERRIDARVRMRQCRDIREDDEAALCSFHPGALAGKRYKVVRAYHGEDSESGMLISDLSLEEVSP